MTMHMQINSPELRRQHEARKARMARLSRWAAYRRGDEDFDAHVLDWQEQQVRLQVRGSDADAHVMHWRRKMSYELERPSNVRLGRDANAHVATYRLFQLLGALDAVERVYVDDIIHLVCRFYNVTRADLLSQRRTANVVKPRQIAMYLAKTLTLRSLPEIGRRFGGRDHTTVLHALRKITRQMEDDHVLESEIAELKEFLSRGKA